MTVISSSGSSYYRVPDPNITPPSGPGAFIPPNAGIVMFAGIGNRPTLGRFTGDLAFDTTTGVTYQWNGVAWQRAIGTRAVGVSLINGTQNLLFATSPNDGQAHEVRVAGYVIVTSAETGGSIQLQYTANGVGLTTLDPGGHGIGTFQLSSNTPILVDPNTSVTLAQNAALTAGTATFTGQIAFL